MLPPLHGQRTHLCHHRFRLNSHGVFNSRSVFVTWTYISPTAEGIKTRLRSVLTLICSFQSFEFQQHTVFWWLKLWMTSAHSNNLLHSAFYYLMTHQTAVKYWSTMVNDNGLKLYSAFHVAVPKALCNVSSFRLSHTQVVEDAVQGTIPSWNTLFMCSLWNFKKSFHHCAGIFLFCSIIEVYNTSDTSFK